MQQTPTKPTSPGQIALTALVLTLGTVAMAHAQGADPLGVSSIKDAVVATFKVLAALGILWGFLRMMTGRHTMEGLVSIGVGALGIAKTDAIVALLGVG
jgi:protein-S-isoprenylcysteine O-methyltransferase Ste14